MFERLEAPANVIAMHLSGTLTTDDVHHYKTLIEEKLAAKERFGIYVEMTELEFIGTDAITEDIRVEFELLTHLGKFRRAAMVSDMKWPGTMARLLSPILPGLEIKTFDVGERAAAIQWASEGPANPKTAQPTSHAAE
jgi:hypothetical protein